MAPQERVALIPSEDSEDYNFEPLINSPGEQSSLHSETVDVVIIQPEGNLEGLSNEDAISKPNKGKGNKRKGAEVPVNCPHLETALFFFGIAGMVVSVIMLLQHVISNITSYY